MFMGGEEGLLANMQASGPLIMILHIDMWHIKGTHLRAIIIIIYFPIRDGFNPLFIHLRQHFWDKFFIEKWHTSTNDGFTDIWFVSFPSAIGRCGPSCPWFCHTRGINDAFIDPHPYGSSRRERQIYIHPSLLLDTNWYLMEWIRLHLQDCNIMLFADVRKSKQSYKDTSMVHGSVSTGGGVIFSSRCS